MGGESKKAMLIGLQNLEKDFGEAVILKGITANVEQGDRIGIVGENGTGKCCAGSTSRTPES